MACNWLNFGKQVSRFWLEHRYIIIRTSECSHCIQRLKQVHCDKLGFILTVVAKNIAAEITVYCLKPRVDHFSQQFFIGV